MSGATNFAALPLLHRFITIFSLLRQTAGDQGHARRFNPHLNHAIWDRLSHLSRRFTQTLACSFAPPPAKPRPNRIRPSTPKPAPAMPLPTRFGWLPRLLPGYQVQGPRSQLTHFLAQPDVVAAIAAKPQLGRSLRPLCHILGIALPPHLQLPRKPRQPRPKPAQQPAQKHARKPVKIAAKPLPVPYAAPQRPMLPGHRYSPAPPFNNSA